MSYPAVFEILGHYVLIFFAGVEKPRHQFKLPEPGINFRLLACQADKPTHTDEVRLYDLPAFRFARDGKTTGANATTCIAVM